MAEYLPITLPRFVADGDAPSLEEWNAMMDSIERGINAALQYRGAWDGASIYSENDAVKYAGSYWRSLRRVVAGVQPGTSATDWDMLGSAGGTSAPTRQSVTALSGSLANGATDATKTIALAKGALLLKVATNSPAWVRLYPDAASRDADAARAITDDPSPNATVALEVVTTAERLVIPLAPAVSASNETGTFYLRITNLGSTGAVTVTLTYLVLEA